MLNRFGAHEETAAGQPGRITKRSFDAMIAAIARSHRAAVATRNTADFQHCGIEVINPWTG
jgi:predicted nucleic acid-binding protein